MEPAFNGANISAIVDLAISIPFPAMKEQWIDRCKWAESPDPFVAKKGVFLAKVVGESMNKRIPNGSWCVFKASPEGSRQGRVVLV